MLNAFQKDKSFRFLAVILLAFLIFAESNLNAFASVYIPVQRITLLTILLGMLLIFMFLKRMIQLDVMIVLPLFFRIPYYLFVSLADMSSRNAFRAHYMIILIAPIVFLTVFSFVQSDVQDVLINLLKISIIVVAVQVHSSLLQLFVSGHALYQIKLSIGIPLGYSNTIASIVLMQIVLAYVLIKNKFYFIISITSLLCTISKSAFLIFIISLFIILLLDSIKKHKLGIFIRYALVLIVILFLANRSFSDYFSEYIKAFNKLLSNNLESINNGRIYIYSGYVNDIYNKPIFGWGLGKYHSVDGMAHNLFLQALFSGGVVGLFIYYIPIFVIMKRSLKWKNSENKRALYALVFVSMAHGFVENFFFTVPCEFLFWIYLTLLYRKGKNDEQNRLCDSQL